MHTCSFGKRIDSLQTSSSLISIYNEPFIYKDVVYPRAYTNPELLKRCENFQFLPDDILVATYPRSGTTLTQEIVWQIVNHETVQKNEKYGQTFDRFPCLEFDLRVIADQLTKPVPNGIDNLSSQASNRLIKTHLPFRFIRHQYEKVNPRTIVVIRNPKDNVVSCYNFYKGVKFLQEKITFSDYLHAYMTSHSIVGEYFDTNLGYWSLRDRENILFLRYEDIVHQPVQEVRKVSLFLGYSLSDEKLATIVHNTSFRVMSKNESINRTLLSGKHKFCRKGKVGDWKDWLTVSQNETMNAWISNKLEEHRLNFIYE